MNFLDLQNITPKSHRNTETIWEEEEIGPIEGVIFKEPRIKISMDIVSGKITIEEKDELFMKGLLET